MSPAEAKTLLLPIPAENFILDKYTNYKDKCCAVGHLQRLTSKNVEALAIYRKKSLFPLIASRHSRHMG